MTNRVPELVIEAILPHLSAGKLNKLMECDHILNRMIKRRRLDLPRHSIKWLQIYEFDEGWMGMQFKDTEGSCQKEKMEKEKLMNNLLSVQVEHLEIVGTSACQLLSEEWLKTVRKVEIWDIDDDEKIVEQFVKKLKTSKLFLTDNKNEMNGAELISSMPSVQQLELEKCNFTQEFFEKLIEKTKMGSGLESLTLEDWNGRPFFIDNFIHFLKNARFSQKRENKILIQTGLGERATFELHEKLMNLKNSAGWTVKLTSSTELLDEYFIRTPNGQFQFKMGYVIL